MRDDMRKIYYMRG